MKKNPRSKSALINVRTLLALLLCTLGLAIGVTAFTGIRPAFAQAMLENDDPDMPSGHGPQMAKDDYLAARANHINKLRGLRKGKKVDPGARAQAVRKIGEQSGIAEGSASTLVADPSAAQSGNFAADVSAASAAGFAWKSVGPSPLPNGQTFNTNNVPVSGRVTAIALHPTNSNIAYVGAAQGGVYRTLDGGLTWTAIFDNADSLAIGSIAIAPSKPSTIYVGTGEGNFGCDSFGGVGVYRIDNADTNPTLSAPLNKDGNGNDVMSGWAIGKIVVHPTNADMIYVGTTTGFGGDSCTVQNDTSATSTKPRGLFRSVNGTSANPTFSRVTMAGVLNGGNRSVSDIEFEPGNPTTLLATVYGSGTAGVDGGVYRTTTAWDAAPTFTRTLTVGTTAAQARTEIAIAKSGAQVIVFAATSESSGTFKRSNDGGVTWSAALGTSGFCGGQCTYDIPIAVDQTDANIVYLGGPGDSGAAHILTKVTNALGTPTFTASQTGIHADSHAIEIDPTNHNTIWTGDDGGIFKSTNAAASWVSQNRAGFVATQFQSLALHSTDANFTIGGTQDNGTECQGPCGTYTGNTWNQADYGDGGFALIDQSSTSLTSVNMYHTYYNQTNTLIGYAYVTSAANAKFTSSPTTDSWSFSGTSCPTNGGGYACTEAVEFYMPLALGPGTPNPMYSGTDRLHRAATPGATNATVSQVFATGVPISAIAISPQDDNVRLVGLDNGKIFRTLTAQTTGWPDITGSVPAGYISRAVIDPTNKNTAYITISAYLGSGVSHIWKTTNLNATTPTWTGLDGGQIPNVPVNAFAVDPANASNLYAGTDVGVYRSIDGGTTWTAFSNGLPRVAVFDMAIQNANRILRIATHGRGMWDISLQPAASLQGYVTSRADNSAISGATVSTNWGATTTDANGFYTLTLPIGTYTVTTSAVGFTTSTTSNVVLTQNQTTTQNVTLSVAPQSGCMTDTTQADFATGVANNVDITASPGDVKLATVINTDAQAADNGFGSGYGFTSTSFAGETFTATAAGTLQKVDVTLFCASCSGTNPNITVELRTTSGGMPVMTSAGLIATSTIPGFSSGTSSTFTATFTTPPTLTAGTVYGLVAKLAATRTGTQAFLASSGDVYTGGKRVTCTATTCSSPTGTNANSDLVFKAYISTGYPAAGDFTSDVFDANPLGSAGWTNMSWTANAPTGTAVNFQAAASNNVSGPFTFVGPDGTANSYFTNTGASLAQFNGLRYLKFKAFLTTASSTSTATLSDITICFNNPAPPPKASQTISFGGLSDKTYGDADFAISATASSGLTVNFSSTGACSVSGGNVHLTGAGSCTITATQNGNQSYSAASPVAQAFNIAKANQTITVTTHAPATATYNSTFTVAANATSTGAVSYSASGACTNSGATFTMTSGTGSCTVNYNQAGTANYNAAPQVSETVSAQKGTATVNFGTLAFAYDGTPKATTASTAPAGLPVDITYAGSSAAPSNVGSYAVVAAVNDANYQGGKTATLIISKAGSTTVVTIGDAIYDGATHGGSAAVTGVGSLDQPVAISYSGTGYGPSPVAPTNAGTYSATATYDGDANHNGSSDTKTFKIAKANATIVVTGYSVTYDGVAHTATATATGVESTPADLANLVHLNNTTHTNAGNYPTDAWTFDGNVNYNGASGTVSDAIAKADATIQVVGYTVTYDAAPHTAMGTAKGVQNETLTGLNLSGTTHTNAGSYSSDAWSFTNANYNDANGTVADRIDQAPSSTAITVANATYDTLQHGGSAVTTGVGGLNQALTVTYAGRNGTAYNESGAPTQAGDYTAAATFAGDANHTGSTDAREFSIAQATPVIAWSNPANIVYGTALSGTELNAVAQRSTATVSGTYDYTPAAGTMLNAGANQTLAVVFTPNDTRNYTGATKSVAINVGQRPITLTADDKAKQFSDAMPDYTASITNGSLVGSDTLGGNLVTTTTATPMSPSGSYTLTLTGSGFNANYAVTLVNGKLTVTQEDATLTYTGDTLVTAGSNNTTTLNLAAFVQEAQDGSLGNALGGKTVKFSIYKSNNVAMTTADATASGLINATTGIATASVSLPADDYTVKLEIVSNGYYTAPVEAAAFTVVNPTSGMTAGGGWLLDPNGRRAHFGFTVRYLPSGNAQGNSNYIYRDLRDLSVYGAPAGVRDYDIIVKSNSMSAMSLVNTTTPGTGTFTGKNNLFAIDRVTGASYNISSGLGLQFQVDVTDNGNGANSGDSYALRIWNSGGTYKAVGGYTASGANTSQVAIGGGNLQVK